MGQIGTEMVTDPADGKEERIEPSFNPIFIMADSGARGSAQQIRQLAGMRGLMAKPSGEIIETPITANFREGLTVLQYFISTHGARKGLADTALKTANSGYLTRRLVDVAQDAIITEYDCGTIDGIDDRRRSSRAARSSSPSASASSAAWRSTTSSTPSPASVLVEANERDRRGQGQAIEDAGIDKVRIRSVLTCQARRGICVECYGRDLARGQQGQRRRGGRRHRRPVDRRAGHPAHHADLPHRRRGVPARRAVEPGEPQPAASVKLLNVAVAKKKDGTLIVMNRNGELVVVDDSGPRARAVPPGLRRQAAGHATGQKVKAGPLLAEWDPFAMPILTEVARPREVRRHRRRRHHERARSTRSPASRARRWSPRRIRTPAPASRSRATTARPASWPTPRPTPATCSPRAPTSSSTTATRSTPATCSPRSRARPPRPRTSPAVCPAWPSSSRPASRRSTPSSPRSTAWSPSARTPRASARWSSRPRWTASCAPTWRRST